ncbi:hypothetical protein EVG20_g8139 [Dentipellis fragilis]|uniref:Velvet domain-containing protein n=1 Tax=Dentipellis fragilis TaxID=205917 RepID=A0A4Y9YC91_9AGAM|nr:hypothetical protein EVG20_g8139 [Dentipellis fragilis]
MVGVPVPSRSLTSTGKNNSTIEPDPPQIRRLPYKHELHVRDDSAALAQHTPLRYRICAITDRITHASIVSLSSKAKHQRTPDSQAPISHASTPTMR